MINKLAVVGACAGVLAMCGFARAQSPKIEDVVAVATVDFKNDGDMYRALLVEGDEGADLYIFQPQPATSDGAMKLVLKKADMVSSGGVWGQMPSLAVNGRGSLIVKSQNDSIGRSRWEQALTVAFRSGDYVIIGLTYSSRDTLVPNSAVSCDLNLATGKGTRNGKPVSIPAKPIRVADWSEDKLPAPCQ